MTRKAAEPLPPHSIDAEQAVLGTVLVRPELLPMLPSALMPESFYRDAHRRIFRAMLALRDRQVEIDLLTLREELVRTGDLEEVGGLGYLTSLSSGLPRTTNAPHYADIVTEHATRRALIRLAHRIMGDAYDGEAHPRDLIATTQRDVVELALGTVTNGPKPSGEIVPETYAAVERWQSAGGIAGVLTGFSDLDAKLSGLQPGALVLLAARPSVGKTALGMNIAAHVSLGNEGAVVLVFSLEMTREELMLRLFAAEACLSLGQIRSGHGLSEADHRRLGAAISRLNDARLDIDDTSALPVEDIVSRARTVQMRRGRLDLVIVDYLQLLSTRAKHESRNQQVSAISRTLKGAAKELKVPILALSQLSRDPEKRRGKAAWPKLSDLRDSGALEQDADVVLFIHREDDDDADVAVADLIIGKQRNGPTGHIKLTYLKEQTRFANYAQD